jgi:hypothetical protein
MWHVRGTGDVLTGFWWGDLMGKDPLEDLGIDGRIILNGSSRNGMERHGLNCSGPG